MATLTIEAGPLSSSVSISDAKLLAMIDALIWAEELAGVPVGATGQERLDWLVFHIGLLVKRDAYEARKHQLGQGVRETLAEEYGEDFVP